MRAAAIVTALVAAGLTVGAPDARAATRCTIPAGPPTHIMSSANGLCVSIEFGWEGARHGTLRARATAPGSWEHIEFIPSPDADPKIQGCLWQVPAGWHCDSRGYLAFKDQPIDYFYAKVVEVRWSQDPSLRGTLQLNEESQSISHLNSTQIFDRLVKNDGSGTQALRSWSNGGFVSAELGWGGDDYGTLRARATTIGAWEEFTSARGDYCFDFPHMCHY